MKMFYLEKKLNALLLNSHKPLAQDEYLFKTIQVREPSV